MKRTAARTVDEYLAKVPQPARATLEQLRKVIKAAVPEAEEVISYQVPTFRHRRPVVAFAAFEDHCSLFVMSPAVMEAFAEDLESYGTSRGTIRFPVDRPLPAALVKRLVKARIAENQAAAKGKQR
jgi:uncharacterized protein YdhG (YjbR/CyaY superfamily)